MVKYKLTFSSYRLLIRRVYTDVPFPDFWDKEALGSLITVDTCNVNTLEVFKVASPTQEPATPMPKPKQNKRKQQVRLTLKNSTMLKPSYAFLQKRQKTIEVNCYYKITDK